jgi:hypothetical protein
MKQTCTAALFFCICLSACVSARPEAKPEWMDRKLRDTPKTRYFRVSAEDASSKKEAEAAVEQALRRRIALTIFSDVQVFLAEYKVASENSEDAGDSFAVSEIELYSGVILSGIKVETFAEEYRSGGNRRWRAWAYAEADASRLEEEAQRYAREYEQNQRNMRENPVSAVLVLSVQGISEYEYELDRNTVYDTVYGALARGLQVSRTPLALKKYRAEDSVSVIFRVMRYSMLYGCVCVLRYERNGENIAEEVSSEFKYLELDRIFNSKNIETWISNGKNTFYRKVKLALTRSE